MKLRILKETYDNIMNQLSFEESSYNYHHGQVDILLKAFFNNNQVGYLDYSLFEGKPYINMIKVHEDYRKMGVGEKLIMRLADVYGYKNIEWGYKTAGGLALQQKIDRIYGYNRVSEEDKSKHLPKEFLNKFKDVSPNVYSFVKDYYSIGNNVWSQMDKYNEKNYEIDGYDPNDLADIVRWIDGAKQNKNHPNDEVPYPIEQDIKRILNNEA